MPEPDRTTEPRHHGDTSPDEGTGPDATVATGWRALVGGVTLRVDTENRLVDLHPGRDAGSGNAGGDLAPLLRRVGRGLTDAMRASDRVVWLHALAAARAGAPQRLRLAMCPPSDGRSWLDVTAHLTAEPDGTVLAALAPVMAESEASMKAADSPRVPSMPELAHELRTPLNAVRGYAQALDAGLFGPLNTRQRDAVAGIAEAGEHLIELANAVLDGARLSEAEALDPAPADPAVAVKRACAILAGTAERAGVTLANRVMPGAPVPHDTAALRQIVVNLLSNAVKASPPGAVVAVDARAADAETGTDGVLTIAVRDAGPGIDAATARGASGPWTRGHVVPGEATGGMGLPLVRRLCALHGGELAFAERQGGGTVASVTLPLRAAEPAGDEAGHDPADADAHGRTLRMAG